MGWKNSGFLEEFFRFLCFNVYNKERSYFTEKLCDPYHSKYGDFNFEYNAYHRDNRFCQELLLFLTYSLTQNAAVIHTIWCKNLLDFLSEFDAVNLHSFLVQFTDRCADVQSSSWRCAAVSGAAHLCR